MENLLHIVKERDNAYLKLETGLPHPSTEKREQLDVLGRWVSKYRREHYAPLETQPEDGWEHPEARGDWRHKYIRLWKEKLNKKKHYFEREERRRKDKLRKAFPDAEID